MAYGCTTNNNTTTTATTLQGALRGFLNQRVLINTGGVFEDVIITEVADNFLRAVVVGGANIGSTKVYQISRIDYVQDLTP